MYRSVDEGVGLVKMCMGELVRVCMVLGEGEGVHG